jgi:cell wall-associated NlpC family hydrolase
MRKSYWKKALLAFVILLTAQFTIAQVDMQAQSVGEEIVSEANNLIGTSYRFGGTSPSTGFDTSGFVYYLHNQQGLMIPRSVSEQANSGTTISKENIRPGDVIFFKNDQGQPSIAAIYVGNGRVITSIPALNGVGIESISTQKAKEQYLVAKRYYNLTENSKLESIIKLAEQLEGTPYQFGGDTPEAFDTSGFVYYVLGEHDITIPRRVADQWQEGTAISEQNLRAGDLIFFDEERNFQEPTNVGIYLGDNRFTMTATQFGQVSEKNLSDYQSYYMGAKRLEAINGSEQAEPTKPTEPPAEDDAPSTNNEAKIVSTVNFRTAPSTSSNTYGVLPRGTIVNVLEEVNRYWLKVEVDGLVGYISASSRFVEYTVGSDTESDPVEEETPTPEPIPGQSTLADKIMAEGEKHLGTPYRFGARRGSGYFDCSLFVQTVFGEFGIDLPRNSRSQARLGDFVEWGEWEKGDLVFFWTRKTGEGTVGHVGIYAGDGKMLNTWGSPGVEYTDFVNSRYWKNTYMGAKRIIGK